MGKITEKQCRRIRKKENVGPAIFAEKFGVTPSAITYHRNGKCAHVNGDERVGRGLSSQMEDDDDEDDEDGPYDPEDEEDDKMRIQADFDFSDDDDEDENEEMVEELEKEANRTYGGANLSNAELLDPDIERSIFDSLQNYRRRLAILALHRHGKMEIGTLTELVAAEVFCPDFSSQERKRIYVGMYQCHLDNMDDSGLVEWDKSRGMVTPTQKLHAAAVAMRVIAVMGNGTLWKRLKLAYQIIRTY